MPAEATLEAKGLWTNVNTLTGIPPGGTTKQTNMRVHKPGLMTPRRGRKSICSLEHGFSRVFDSGSFLIAFGLDDQIYYSTDNGVSWTIFTDWVGSIANVYPTWGMAHFYSFGLNNSFFFNTNRGIQVVSSSSGGYRPAGVPYGLNCKVMSLAAPGTAVPPNSRVGYRAVFGLRNPTGQVELGAPSQRAVAINSSVTDTVNPLIEIVIPPGIVIGKHFWQLYRTYPSADAAVDPGDDMSLVFEGEFKSSFTTDTLSRLNNTATVHSLTPHNLQPGDVVNLDTLYDPPATAGTISDVVNVERPLNFSTAAAAFKRESINSAGVASPLADIPLGAALSTLSYPDATAYYPRGRWIRSDTLGYNIFVHPQIREIRVYKTGVTGLDFAIPTGGYTIDCAALSADGEKLYIVCPTVAETDNLYTASFNYRFDSGMKFGVINLVTKTLVWTPSAAALPTPLANATHAVLWYTNHQALFNSPCFVTKGTDNIERFVICSVNYNNNPNGASRLALVNYFYTTNFGQSWTSIYPTNVVSPETVEERHTAGANMLPRYSYSMARSIDAFGVVRVIPVHRGRSTNVYLWAGLIRTVIPITLTTSQQLMGVSINALNGTFTFLIATVNSTVVTLLRFNSGNYSVATTQTSTVPTPGSGVLYHWCTLYDGPNGGGTIEMIEELPISPPTRWFRNLPVNSVTPSAAVQGIYYDQSASRGTSNPQDIIFYPGTYIIETIVDPNTFTVHSVGPDFTVVPYSAFVNFNVISVVDNVAPGAVGPALYTSPSQEGIGQANFPPPLAKDIETFRSYGFYANATIQAYLPITLFSVGVESIDLNIGDMVLIYDSSHSAPAAVLTAAAAEDFANSQFKLVTNAGSPYENIRQTIESLSACINQYSDARPVSYTHLTLPTIYSV